MKKNGNLTVYVAIGTYVTRSSLHSYYSQLLLSYILPCTISDMCERCLHGFIYKAKRVHGDVAVEWHSNVWAHMWCAANQGQLSQNSIAHIY